MNDSIFEVRKSAIPTKRLSVTITKELDAEIDEVVQMLNEINPDLQFNVNTICVQAIETAVRKAKKEITRMRESTDTVAVLDAPSQTDDAFTQKLSSSA